MFAFAQRSAGIGRFSGTGSPRASARRVRLRAPTCQGASAGQARQLRSCRAHMKPLLRFSALLSLFYALTSQVVSGASEATMFRGNVEHTGVYDAPGVPELH